MKNIKEDIRFTKRERISLSILIFILLASYCVQKFVLPELRYNQNTQNLEDILVKHDADGPIETELKVKDFIATRKRKKKKIIYSPPPKYEAFNPNNIDSLKWIQLGVKPWTISTILKYQAKGGKFYKCQDLAKVYNLPDSVFNKLVPYCNIPAKKWDKPYTKSKFKKYTGGKFRTESSDTVTTKKRKKRYSPPIVDLNTSDTAVMSKLYGIGPVLSERIIKYRKALGGFHTISQLTEVFGVEQKVLDDNEEKLTLEGSIEKLNLNSPVDSLAKHPYLGWEKARIITNYRKQHGNFSELTDLKKTRVISDSLYNRLLPYISTE